MLPSKLISYIEGGNRISGFANYLVITGYGRDPDIPNEEESFKNLQYLWQCINLNTNEPCGIILPYSKNITIHPKRLMPYNAYEFKLIVTKGTRSESSKVQFNFPLIS